ncbi:MAG: pyridoxal-phosphate dependent enzyme, partial [bacterium]
MELKVCIMPYISTRGHAAPVELKDLLTRGTAEDGGLYVPKDWPELSVDELSSLAHKSYGEIAAGLLNLFGSKSWIDAGFDEDIRQSLDAFEIPDGPPVIKLDEQLWALELFHGPTFAFKDYALSPLAQTIERKLHLEDGQATVLCATSGDTGAATAAAFASRSRTRAVILFPEGRISGVQRRQMTTLDADNVCALSVKGDFDDCQRLVKALYRSEQATDYGYTAVNSINLVRILLQTAYYVYSAFKVQRETGEAANVIVPTG